VDLVILVVHLGLNGAVTDLKSTEEDEVLSSLKRATAHSDLIEHLVPLLDLVSQDLVDQVFLLIDVPEGLIVAPGVNIRLCLSEDHLDLSVDRLDVKLLAHHHKEALVGLLLTIIVSNRELFKATDHLHLVMELFVPVSFGFSKGWL
jgi:hypothetical protein